MSEADSERCWKCGSELVAKGTVGENPTGRCPKCQKYRSLSGGQTTLTDGGEPAIGRSDFPEIVCLCGSTRFEDAFKSEQFRLTVEEQSIALTVAGNWKDGHDDVWDEIDGEEKERLDELHFRKIELADRVHVLNVDGYVGSSTSNEIQHAMDTGTEITWLEPESVPEEFGEPELMTDGGVDETGTDCCPKCDQSPEEAMTLMADYVYLCPSGHVYNEHGDLLRDGDDGLRADGSGEPQEPGIDQERCPECGRFCGVKQVQAGPSRVELPACNCNGQADSDGQRGGRDV